MKFFNARSVSWELSKFDSLVDCIGFERAGASITLAIGAGEGVTEVTGVGGVAWVMGGGGGSAASVAATEDDIDMLHCGTVSATIVVCGVKVAS